MGMDRDKLLDIYAEMKAQIRLLDIILTKADKRESLERFRKKIKKEKKLKLKKK